MATACVEGSPNSSADRNSKRNTGGDFGRPLAIMSLAAVNMNIHKAKLKLKKQLITKSRSSKRGN